MCDTILNCHSTNLVSVFCFSSMMVHSEMVHTHKFRLRETQTNLGTDIRRRWASFRW